MSDSKSLKQLLLDARIPEENTSAILGYFNDARRAEKAASESARRNNRQQPSMAVTNSDDTQLYSLAVKYYNLGVMLDGINAVVTGKNMVMVTYHGYKNKILATYPETEIDIQLVRDTDNVSFSKQSGKVTYSHELGDPFKSPGNIIGAYVVIKNKRGEFLETLNRTDYEQMRDQSKQSSLWKKWESEFVLKSVMKRACKRHFNDVVAEIDKIDNDQYGIDEAKQQADENRELLDSTIAQLTPAKNVEALRQMYMALPPAIRNHKEIVAAKNRLKAELDKATAEEPTE